MNTCFNCVWRGAVFEPCEEHVNGLLKAPYNSADHEGNCLAEKAFSYNERPFEHSTYESLESDIIQFAIETYAICVYERKNSLRSYWINWPDNSYMTIFNNKYIELSRNGSLDRTLEIDGNRNLWRAES